MQILFFPFQTHIASEDSLFTNILNQTSKYEEITQTLLRRQVAMWIMEDPDYNRVRFDKFIGPEKGKLGFHRYIHNMINHGSGNAGRY